MSNLKHLWKVVGRIKAHNNFRNRSPIPMRTWEANLDQKAEIFRAAYLSPCTDWPTCRSVRPIFMRIDATSLPCGAKMLIFGPRVKTIPAVYCFTEILPVKTNKRHIFALTPRAGCSISSKLCMVMEDVETILKGANHFPIQDIVFPTGCTEKFHVKNVRFLCNNSVTCEANHVIFKTLMQGSRVHKSRYFQISEEFFLRGESLLKWKFLTFGATYRAPSEVKFRKAIRQICQPTHYFETLLKVRDNIHRESENTDAYSEFHHVENNVTGDADISLEKIQKAINYTKQ